MLCKFHTSISDIPASVWDDLFDSENPFVQHAFLLALEQSGCVTTETGWQPQHMLILDDDQPLAVIPMYAKTHSYGEFVFDWGWKLSAVFLKTLKQYFKKYGDVES